MLLLVRPNAGEGGTEPLIAEEDAEMRESGIGKTIIPQLSFHCRPYSMGDRRSGE